MIGSRPNVDNLKCILTGPEDNKSRIAFQEFHLLSATMIYTTRFLASIPDLR